MRFRYWAPPALWMALILWLSSDAFSATETGAILIPLLRRLLPWATGAQLFLVHAGIRKAAHLTLYAVLALLWYRAFRQDRRFRVRKAAQVAFVIALAWAGVDEGHQALTVSRTGRIVDVTIDSAGAAFALVAVRRYGPRSAKPQ